MATEGEPIEVSDQPGAKGVADLSQAQFLEAAVGLSQGRDMGGRELSGSPRFCLGAGIGPWSNEKEARQPRR